MRNPIDIDHTQSRAIGQEIGERLQQYLRAEPELPTSIRRQVDRLGESWWASPALNRSRRGTTVLGDGPNEEVSRDFE
jgi:hypothetical protein